MMHKGIDKTLVLTVEREWLKVLTSCCLLRRHDQSKYYRLGRKTYNKTSISQPEHLEKVSRSYNLSMALGIIERHEINIWSCSILMNFFYFGNIILEDDIIICKTENSLSNGFVSINEQVVIREQGVRNNPYIWIN